MTRTPDIRPFVIADGWARSPNSALPTERKEISGLAFAFRLRLKAMIRHALQEILYRLWLLSGRMQLDGDRRNPLPDFPGRVLQNFEFGSLNVHFHEAD